MRPQESLAELPASLNVFELDTISSHPSILKGESHPDLIDNATLVDIFRRTARSKPFKLALSLIGSTGRMTYGELDRVSDCVAAFLREKGVIPGDLVGLWLPRSLEAHIALLGILKAGAGYVPFDEGAPVARVATCIRDCGARFLISGSHMLSAAAGHLTEVEVLETEVLDIAELAVDRGLDVERSVSLPALTAYVIYTSGTTGTPKGVKISHRNVTHFVRAANRIYGINESDIIFQGASLSFDLSVEEIWLAYSVGATLKVATSNALKDFDQLLQSLAHERVTILDVVPTFLSLLPGDVPSVRTIILGGEACPQALADRWLKPGRRVFNSYGPTETTVVATCAEYLRGQSVTIGRPIANYSAYVVNEDLELVEAGEVGELLIGGPGVAGGYINLPEKSNEKFIPNRFARGDCIDPVLYRTGDAVSISSKGELCFHGRVDTQIKLRGFRIELEEIEALISSQPGVNSAAVCVKKLDHGDDILVAYVHADAHYDLSPVKAFLSKKLPVYMIPAVWRVLSGFPVLPSGKVDRRALSALAISFSVDTGITQLPKSSMEEVLLKAAKTVLMSDNLALEADFFDELGGHSMAAARFISELRKVAGFPPVSLRDLYEQRTLQRLGALLEDRLTEPATAIRSQIQHSPKIVRRWLCGFGQAIALPIILTMATLQWLGSFLLYIVLEPLDLSWSLMGVLLIAGYALIRGLSLTGIIAIKWLVNGRTKPGRYPLWGLTYFRWWFTSRLIALGAPGHLALSPLAPLFFRALGARIAKDVILANVEFGAPDLVTIGKGSSIGSKTVFANAEIVGDEFIVGVIQVGSDVYIGNQCVLQRECSVYSDARLEDLTCLPEGAHVGPGEIWDGSPGRLVARMNCDELPGISHPSWLWQTLRMPLFFCLSLVISMLSLLSLAPGFIVLDVMSDSAENLTSPYARVLALGIGTWAVSGLLVLLTISLVVALRWVLLPRRVQPGTYSIHSWLYLRKWAVNLASELGLESIASLHATLFMPMWYRLMGAKIGCGTEISTSLGSRYDLVSIGAHCFMADDCSLGDEDIHRGWLTMHRTEIRERVFVGNSAVISQGAQLGSGALIGVKSKNPSTGVVRPNQTWLGSPPFPLSVREHIGGFDSVHTFAPTRARRCGRAIFEALHITLPTALYISFGTIAIKFMSPFLYEHQWGKFIGAIVCSSIAIPVALVLAVVTLKWALIGTFRPTVRPMWSWWAMRAEAIAGLYWGLGGRALLEHLRGTPFLPFFLRLFGMKVGKGACLDTTDFTEFDCIIIGDDVRMNSLSCLQSHLFEDRILKVGTIKVGRDVTIGSFSTVLYDTEVKDFSMIAPLSLLMKGEKVDSEAFMQGIPAGPGSINRQRPSRYGDLPQVETSIAAVRAL